MLNQIMDKLPLFEAVATTQSIKEAALILGLTPSAVSQALKKLEGDLGGQLFLREHKKISLSPLGKRLKSELLPILGQMNSMLNVITEELSSDSPSGTLSIGAPIEIGTVMLVQLFADFQKKYPRMKGKFRFASPTHLMELVNNGELDFCLAADGEHFKQMPESISAKKIFDEEFALLGHKDLIKKKKSIYTFEDLIDLPHLDYRADGSAVTQWYQHNFRKKPKNLNIVMVSENSRALMEAIKNGLGVAMIPKNRFVDLTTNSDIIEFKTGAKKLLNPILLIQHKSKIPTRGEKIFLQSLSRLKD